MEKEKSYLQKIDYGLITILFLLTCISILAIYSATMMEHGFYYIKRQLMWYGLGFVTMLSLLFVDYRRLKILSIPFYIVGILLLVALIFWGIEEKGAQSWFDFEGIRMQPSEIMKIFLIIANAHLLSKFHKGQGSKLIKDDLSLTVKVGFITAIPFVLILKEPDLGTALVLLGIMSVMLFIAGISWRILFSILFLGIGGIASLVFLYFVNFELFDKLIESHQLVRIFGWLNPEEYANDWGYQLLQSLMAIGSGRLEGKGMGEGSYAINWIPELHTDFIFAIISEEFGFIGASVLISIYFILIYRLVQIALTCNDTFGSYLVAGVIGLISFQVFQNIGMTIGLLPITGLTLPFISYGGSSLVTNMIAMGIVLNVAMRTKVYMFD